MKNHRRRYRCYRHFVLQQRWKNQCKVRFECRPNQKDPHYRCGEHRTCDFSFATTQRRCGHQGWTTAVVCAKTIRNPSRRVHQKGTKHKKTVVPVVLRKYEAGYDNTALTCIYMCGKIESEETVSLPTGKIESEEIGLKDIKLKAIYNYKYIYIHHIK